MGLRSDYKLLQKPAKEDRSQDWPPIILTTSFIFRAGAEEGRTVLNKYRIGSKDHGEVHPREALVSSMKFLFAIWSK